VPSLARTTQGPLGCGSYTARLVNDGQVILDSRRVTSVLWNRRADEKSTSTLTLPVQGTDLTACCESSQRIEPLRTEIIISRDAEPVWQGWLMGDVGFTRDNIVVNGQDILGWTERRVLNSNHVDTNVDLTNIALSYLGDVNAASDLPFVIISTLSGVLATRSVLASEYKYAWGPLKELLDTGLDATVVAGVLYLGPETVTCGTLQLRDTDIDGDPELKLDGAQRATRVIVVGGNGIVATYPPAPPDVCYHAADYVQQDDKILDQASADNAAQLLYARLSSSFPYYLSIPQGSTLKPSAPVHINALVPGNVFQVYVGSLCLPVGMAMRLTALDVEVGPGGSEQVRPTFEPLGDLEGD